VEGGTIEGSVGDGKVELEEILRVDLTEAAGYVALPLIGRGKGITLLLRGIKPEDIN